MVTINGFVVMNSAYTLNARPPSDLRSCRFPIRCTTRKVIKKSPVRAMTNFFPFKLEKRLANQFISSFCGNSDGAKNSPGSFTKQLQQYYLKASGVGNLHHPTIHS